MIFNLDSHTVGSKNIAWDETCRFIAFIFCVLPSAIWRCRICKSFSNQRTQGSFKEVRTWIRMIRCRSAQIDSLFYHTATKNKLLCFHFETVFMSRSVFVSMVLFQVLARNFSPVKSSRNKLDFISFNNQLRELVSWLWIMFMTPYDIHESCWIFYTTFTFLLLVEYSFDCLMHSS